MQSTSVVQLHPVLVNEFLPVVVVAIFGISTTELIDRSCSPLTCIFKSKSFFVMACFQYVRNRSKANVINCVLSVSLIWLFLL